MYQQVEHTSLIIATFCYSFSWNGKWFILSLWQIWLEYHTELIEARLYVRKIYESQRYFVCLSTVDVSMLFTIFLTKAYFTPVIEWHKFIQNGTKSTHTHIKWQNTHLTKKYLVKFSALQCISNDESVTGKILVQESLLLLAQASMGVSSRCCGVITRMVVAAIKTRNKWWWQLAKVFESLGFL